MEGRIAILISHKNYLCFLNSFFNKSTTKQVKVFIFLFEISTSGTWQALSNETPAHWPYSTWISATCCALLYIIIICFTLPCVLQITDTQKYNVVAPLYIFFLWGIYCIYICRTSGSMKLGYLRNTRILKFFRNDIMWCSHKKITFNTLYRLILGWLILCLMKLTRH